MDLPPEYRFEFLGNAKSWRSRTPTSRLAFSLAFIFMYMILAAQFESLVHPISILAALPLTIPFAVLSLILLRTNLDIFAMLGLFMLFGIVKKNGILQVDYTNQLRARGMARERGHPGGEPGPPSADPHDDGDARGGDGADGPGQGPGAGSRSSMAKVILGGQALSLLLTLLVTPVAYSLWDGLGRRLSSWTRRAG